MATYNSADQLSYIIKSAIEAEINKQAEKAIERAKEGIAKSIREFLGRVTLSVLNHFSVQNLAREIVIHVKIEEEAK